MLDRLFRLLDSDNKFIMHVKFGLLSSVIGFVTTYIVVITALLGVSFFVEVDMYNANYVSLAISASLSVWYFSLPFILWAFHR